MQFPPFAIDSQRHVLTRDGEDVALSPHLVDILSYLATRSGEIVSKDALLEAFWPEVHVTENTLTRAIADIRKALGDDASEPQFIQTVARRGYRFIVPVRAHEDTRRQVPVLAAEDPFREWVRGRLSLEALDSSKLPAAVTAFEHAVAATPEYAPAHAGLANACFLQFECTRAENTPNREPLLRAIAHARRACELDQALGEAWATLGFVLTAAGQGEEARAAARRAAALEPTSWRHYFRLGIASWGEERLRAVDRTLSLLPGFAPARFLAAMVFIARHAFGPAAEAAATGAAAQTREASSEASLFPAVGLHWLHGLLLLRKGHVGPAITSFAHEIDQSQTGQIYAREFRVNAQVAAGFAHLAAHDPGGATDAFRSALETLPRNGRALIGLYLAFQQTSLAPEAPQLLPKIEEIVAELASGGRRAEAAIVSAALHVARGDVDTACDVLQRLLDEAPPGQAGWLIPIDPALATLRSSSGFEKIAAQLATRAA
jgi:DNA-binding winged helix-turn-helix (wHTH) protein/Flp pilus assembly protein TadD